MPKGYPDATECPQCKHSRLSLRAWKGRVLAGHTCSNCGWGEWWKIGAEEERLPSQNKFKPYQLRVPKRTALHRRKE